MKKSLLIFTCITGLLQAESYSQLRSDLKEKLFQKHQKSQTITHHDYMRFIEKYIAQAEQDLTIIREISKIPDITEQQASAFKQYLDTLGTLHGYIFDNLIKPEALGKKLIQFFSTCLQNDIENLKNELFLDINPEMELKNTLNLLRKANEDFIKYHVGRKKSAQIRRAKRWDNAKVAALSIPLAPLFYFGCL